MAFWPAFSAFAQPKREAVKEAQQPQKAAFAALRLSSEQLAELIEKAEPDFFLIDVRTPEEFRAGAIPSAINIPYDQLAGRLPTQDRGARIVVYCRSGNRSAAAKAALDSLGFTAVNDFGGIGNWKGRLIVR